MRMSKLTLGVASFILGWAGLGCGGSSSGVPNESAEAGDTGGGGAGGDANLPGSDVAAPEDAGSRDASATDATATDALGAKGGATEASSDGGSAPWIMGYYANWDEPANGGFYPVSAIDWDSLTIVATAFYVPDGNGGWVAGNFDAPTAASVITAAHTHGKKAIASIGGSGSGPGFEGSTNTANMATFLSNLQDLLSMGYDGLDIDWEGGSLTTAQDQALETSLVTSLRTHNPGIVLTFTAGYENENSLDDLSFYGTLSAEVDRINLMTYGMAGAWSGWESWHSSPLHWNQNTSTPTGIDTSVQHYLAAGVPASKLGVGSGFYGECYTSPVTAPVQTLGASDVAASDGVMSYRNIMASYYSSAAYHYDTSADVPYLTLSGTNAEACTYVTYEDATSVGAKAAWVKAQGLGGIIIWTLSEGYITAGTTVTAQNPLLEAMKAAL
jgi:chitinase